MKKVVDTWAPVIVWMLLIFSFSSIPTNPVSEIHWKDFVIKKTAHIVIYAILTLLTYRASRDNGLSKEKAVVVSVLFAVLYGVTDEYHQSFTPGRDPQLRDVVFDTIGSVLAAYFLRSYLPKAPRPLKKLAKEWGLIKV